MLLILMGVSLNRRIFHLMKGKLMISNSGTSIMIDMQISFFIVNPGNNTNN